MKTNKKSVSANKKGFTLIEILIIVAIIGILVTVVLVSTMSNKEKAQDNSAFTSFKSIAAPAFMCLTSGIANVQLTGPTNIATICSGAGVISSGWPDFTKDAWSNTLSASLSASKGFYWCPVGYTGNSHPTSVGAYSNGTFGGDNSYGGFCFMMKKESKYIWCTLEGCHKEGF
jgi:prepilin-type N-terminal cleavage/methylation domain-containing protein